VGSLIEVSPLVFGPAAGRLRVAAHWGLQRKHLLHRYARNMLDDLSQWVSSMSAEVYLGVYNSWVNDCIAHLHVSVIIDL